MPTPSSTASASSSAGGAHAASAAGAAGRRRSAANSRSIACSICCSSVGVRSKRSRGVGRRRAGAPSRFAAVNVRPAVPAARKPSRVARWSTRVAPSRMPRRSSTSEEASVRTARSPSAMPRGPVAMIRTIYASVCKRAASSPWLSADSLRRPMRRLALLLLIAAARRLRRRRHGAGRAGAGAHAPPRPRRRRRAEPVEPSGPSGGGAPFVGSLTVDPGDGTLIAGTGLGAVPARGGREARRSRSTAS